MTAPKIKLMNCEICGRETLRAAHNQKYCPLCRRLVQARRERESYDKRRFSCQCNTCSETFLAKRANTKNCPGCRMEKRARNMVEREGRKQRAKPKVKLKKWRFSQTEETVARLGRLWSSTPRPRMEVRRTYREKRHY